MEKELRKKIYQMFILGLEEDHLPLNSNLYKALKNGLGGVILFSKNIKTIDQTKKLNEQIKAISEISPFLSIDEEGGRVERTENIFGGKKFLSAKFAAQKGVEFLTEQTKEISQLLKEMSFNLNFAPCLDVNSNPKNPIIGERAYSDDTNSVIKYGKIVNDTYLQCGIIPCGKHFPGHGDASVDSHIELPVIDLSMEELEQTHIKPFFEVNPPMIMVAHLHCKAFDNERIPSSLSKNVVGYLKDRYDGLIISDDMVMGGVVNEADAVQNALNAINAGINILLYRNSDDKTINIMENILSKALENTELQRKIDVSYKKIIDFKQNCKLM